MELFWRRLVPFASANRPRGETPCRFVLIDFQSSPGSIRVSYPLEFLAGVQSALFEPLVRPATGKSAIDNITSVSWPGYEHELCIAVFRSLTCQSEQALHHWGVRRAIVAIMVRCVFAVGVRKHW